MLPLPINIMLSQKYRCYGTGQKCYGMYIKEYMLADIIMLALHMFLVSKGYFHQHEAIKKDLLSNCIGTVQFLNCTNTLCSKENKT